MKMIRLKWWYDEVMKLPSNSETDLPSPILELLNVKIDTNLKDSFEAYFQSFQNFLNTQPSDPTEQLYDILCSLIDDVQSKDRFIAILQYHDELPEGAPLRALRLWFKKITHR